MRFRISSHLPVALLLVSGLFVAVSVIAQLATTNGLAAAVWATVTAVGIVVVLVTVVVITRQKLRTPPEG